MPVPNWNPRVYPAGGWTFVDADGVKHRGTSKETLIKAISEFRVRNSMPPGDPDREITERLCKRFPDACTGGEVPATARPPENKSTNGREKMALAVSVWMSKIARAVARVGNPDQIFTGKAEADRRAAICAECPLQVRWDTNCGSCSSGHRRMSFALRRGREADLGPKLLACSVLSEDTRLSVFLESLQPVKSDELPEKCWRKAK